MRAQPAALLLHTRGKLTAERRGEPSRGHKERSRLLQFVHRHHLKVEGQRPQLPNKKHEEKAKRRRSSAAT